MAQPPSRRSRPVRTLVVLGAVMAALFGTIFVGTQTSDATWTPKLALDLEGGTQIILTAVTENDEPITSETISQAINVIRQRVDSSGVAEAEITSQGGRNIVVSLPGTPDEETIALVSKSAQLTFRPVLAIGAPTPATDTTTESPAPESTESATEAPSAEPSAEATAPSDTPTKAAPDSPSDTDYYVTPAVEAAFNAFDCTDPANLVGGQLSPADKALVTCDTDGSAKYLLGPVEVKGTEVSSATSGLGRSSTGVQTNQWVVNLKFNSEGTTLFRETTTRLQGLTSPQNQFAIVLDGLVVSAPSLSPGVIISNGEAEISGSFTRETAATLANQLNFGALPLTFTMQSQEQISATLGTEQLQKGLIAGAIGLLLVVIYSLFQYRALGLVTVASLLIAAVLTFGVIALLSWTQGYRLSLPGVAGLIVAIGITADSFIVYFERIRDELRDGRTLGAAVDRGWDRARRTILASDAVNFLAAVVLYFLAVGGVRGFAFTLGLTTVIDLLVVFCFTHPLMTLLAKTRFFAEGHRFSGLDPRRLGAPATRYVGRGKVVTKGAAGEGETHALDADHRVPVSAGVNGHTMTIAERRAAERAAAEDRGTSNGSVEDSEAAPEQPGTSNGASTPPDESGEQHGSGRTEGNEH